MSRNANRNSKEICVALLQRWEAVGASWMLPHNTGKVKILMWPGLRQYFEFWAHQYFEQTGTRDLHVTLCFDWAKVDLSSIIISKSLFCTTSILNFPVPGKILAKYKDSEAALFKALCRRLSQKRAHVD